MIDFGNSFSNALSYEDFLAQLGSEVDRQKWQRVLDRTVLSEQQTSLLNGFSRELRLLCMAGAWCGDCVRQCPVLQRFALTQPLIKLRFIDRDANDELKNELQICGAPRVPQVVFLSEDDQQLGRYGDRTVSYYRDLGEKVSGAVCSTGVVGDHDPLFEAVVADWLAEVERAHLILRTSPRLREKHGD